jgi:putative hydrolase of the HAD superfamily
MGLKRTIFWDFDETLASRDGRWSDVLFECLVAEAGDERAALEDLRVMLRTGFPWHTPEIGHPELSSPEMWWDRLNGVLAAALTKLGCEEVTAKQAASRVRDRYLDPRSWSLRPGAASVLETLNRQGWSHVLVSNHVPELNSLVSALGLQNLLDAVVTSATIGYEKPHRAFAEAVIREVGSFDTAWVVGDSVHADVGLAEVLHCRSILIGSADPRATYSVQELSEIPLLIERA